jgi:toxin ParE1/3/4
VSLPPYRLTEIAEQDVAGILIDTDREFGPRQRGRYERLLEAAARMVAENPLRPGSRARDDLGHGIRSFHIERAARRRGAAAHVLYFLRGKLGDGRDGIVIVRILHEAMEPAHHIATGIEF